MTYSREGAVIKPQAVVETIYRLTKGKAIITTEVGQNQMWAAQFNRYHKPRTFISSGGLGTMATVFRRPSEPRWPFRTNWSSTWPGTAPSRCASRNWPRPCAMNCVKIVILNNGYLGMVRQWQELFYAKNYCATCMDAAPDFVRLAEAYGAVGYRVTDPAEVEKTLKEAFALPRPVIVDVIVDREENVYPIGPGRKIHHRNASGLVGARFMRHIISILVENEPCVLSRVAGLFSGRGFNIETLNVAPTLTPGLSIMTITPMATSRSSNRSSSSCANW